jgi:hypothetical protein
MEQRYGRKNTTKKKNKKNKAENIKELKKYTKKAGQKK